MGFFVVDPTGLAPVSLRANGNMLLHTPQARIHRYYVKTDKTLFQGPYLQHATLAYGLDHVTFSSSIASLLYLSTGVVDFAKN